MSKGYFMLRVSAANMGSQSAPAMAAYRSGEKLYSERDGLTKNYKERFVQPESFIMKPDHAPEWALNREQLWNQAEAAETQENGRMAREVLVALPNKMDDEQQRELVREFAQENFVDDGMVADINIHRDDANNPHAHIMLTTRPFDQEGNFEKRKSKRVPQLDEQGNQKYNEKGWKLTHSVKLTDWDNRSKVTEWRANWAEKLNEKARLLGLDEQYSEKSFEEQGRLEKAQLHLTRNEYQYEKSLQEQAEARGETYQPQTYYAKKNAEIKKYNERFADVVHLEDYKTQKDYKQDLDHLRKTMHVNNKNVEATRLLADRQRGYVDYQVAQKMHDEFTNNQNKWKLKLERAFRTNEAKERFALKMKEQFKDNPKLVERYGYSLDHFEQEIKNELNEISQSKDKINEEYSKFEELKQASITSFEYQKELLDMEFSAVYDDANIDQFSYDEKHFAMQMVKDYNVLLPEEKIQEEMANQDKYSEYQRSYTPTWKQAKDLMTSISIYDRTINKLKQADINNLASQELKETIIKVDQYKHLKADYEQHLSEIEPAIDAKVDRVFTNQALNEASLDVKVAALESYDNLSEEQQQELDIQEFVHTLQTEHTQQAQYLNEKAAEDREHREVYRDNANKAEEISSGLFDVLKQLGQERASEDDRQNRDRTKVFRKRGADGREL